MPRDYDGVAVTCPVTVPYTRRSNRHAHWFIGSALRGLIQRSGLAKTDVDGFSASSFTLGPDTSIALTEHFGMTPRWLEWIPTGGASGVMALRRAARAVQDGDAEIVACVAGDTANERVFEDLRRRFSRFASEAVHPFGAGGPNAVFALITDHYIRRFGATREDLARIAMGHRANAVGNPNALLGHKPLTLEDYLNAPPIATPLHLFDCVMPCAGAEGFLVMSVERAKALGLPYATIRGAIERHNAFSDDPVAVQSGWAMDRDQLWAQAGVEPAAIDCAQLYDDYPVVVMMQLEDLGFCEKGGAAAFIREQGITVDGSLPINTSGGQLSCGQAGAAGGFLPVVEAIRQVTGEVLGRQVEGARLALASGYGMVNFDRCLAAGAAILEGQRS